MDKLKKSSGNKEKKLHLKKLRKGGKIVVTVSGNVEKTCQKRRKLRKEKKTEYKKEMREKGVSKSISNLSNRQQCIRRKHWKKDSRNYRKRKSLQQAKETPEAEETRAGSRGSPRIQSGRKASKHTYRSLRYKLQSMIAKSLKQVRKIENLRKENYRLKSKDKSKCSSSPATKDAFDEYTVKFMRKCGKDKFTFPENDDIAEVGSSNIVNVLSQPSLNKREHYVFNENLEHYNLT
ncbi:hypothetical protein AVEN_66767-1 [Araneus ventricosus]|uniref:Uncharacterized protein n=1 Tax=Araneus ventricosus TaxID=182803 RepID=A0A4Y2SLX9_ARAVE|nr:hypothetical protein AVEN_66767-1 [Araneus ventricosus]